MQAIQSKELTIKKTVDKKAWSEFVYSHPQGNVFQTPEMYEVYDRAKDHEPVKIFAIDSGGKINASLLGVIRTEKDYLKFLTSWSLVIGGPIFFNVNSGVEVLEEYDRIAQRKAMYNEIRMLNDPKDFGHIFENRGYFFEDHFNAYIRLDKPKEELWRQLKDDKKRGINRAKKRGIVIEESLEKEEIEIFYSLLKETYNRAKIPLPHISLYEAIFDILGEKRMAKFLFAKYNGEYIACQLALIYKDTIHALITGAIREYMKYNPGDLLIWHLLEWGNENGFKLFDFGGGGSPTKNQNIRYYKSRFGTEFPNYGRYKKIYSQIKMKIAEIGINIYRRI